MSTQPCQKPPDEHTSLLHEWRLLDPKAKMFAARAAIIASIGGLLFGYDIGVVEGALPLLRNDMHLNFGQQDMVVAVMVGGAIAGKPTSCAMIMQITHGMVRFRGGTQGKECGVLENCPVPQILCA